jgi:hypothetical protein
MTGPVPVSGLFENHLTVSELTRSTAFYRDVIALRSAGLNRYPEMFRLIERTAG